VTAHKAPPEKNVLLLLLLLLLLLEYMYVDSSTLDSRYTDKPELYLTIATAVREHLDAAGLQHVQQHVTEFFPCILCSEEDTAQGAAAFGATLTTLVHADVKAATLYPLCSSSEGRTGGHGWGLFDDESVPGTAVWRPLTHVYAAFGDLMQRTPLQLVTSSPNTTAFTVLAGSSGPMHPSWPGGPTLELRALVSSATGSGCTRVVLTFAGFEAAASQFDFTVTVVNGSGTNLEALAGNARPSPKGELTLTFDLVEPAVAMVRLTGINSEQTQS
jgi:hypothetical protein